jgi:hypothetical protein
VQSPTSRFNLCNAGHAGLVSTHDETMTKNRSDAAERGARLRGHLWLLLAGLAVVGSTATAWIPVVIGQGIDLQAVESVMISYSMLGVVLMKRYRQSGWWGLLVGFVSTAIVIAVAYVLRHRAQGL